MNHTLQSKFPVSRSAHLFLVDLRQLLRADRNTESCQSFVPRRIKHLTNIYRWHSDCFKVFVESAESRRLEAETQVVGGSQAEDDLRDQYSYIPRTSHHTDIKHGKVIAMAHRSPHTIPVTGVRVVQAECGGRHTSYLIQLQTLRQLVSVGTYLLYVRKKIPFTIGIII